MHRILLLLVPLHLFLASALMAQGAVVVGTIRSSGLVPLPGARVEISSLGISTLSGGAGTYRLVLPRDLVRGQSEVVRVSLVGYVPEEIRVTISPTRTRADATLSRQVVALEELVVTGTAGAREVRAQPAVVTTVDAADLARTAPVSSVPDLLQSRVPGLSMTPSSGSSGQAQRIRIRGASSITVGNEPLFFVDGVRADSRILGGNAANGGQATSRLLDLNSDDVERIEVVKGPAAATLYGADASGGVIQIFTKRGRIGAGRFSQSISAEYNHIDANWTPPSNFAQCRAVDVAPESSSTLCRGKPVGTVVEDNPLLREGVLRNGQLRALNWSARGGGAAYGYYVSLGADDEQGTLPSNAFERRSGRANFDFLPHPTLRFDAGVGLVRTVTDLPQNGDNPTGFMLALMGSPLTVGGANNGWFAPNLHSEAITAVTNTRAVLRATPSLLVQHNPVSWFTQRMILGGDVSHSEGRAFFPRNDSRSYGGSFDTGFVAEERIHYDIFTADYIGTARHRFGREDQWASDLSFGFQAVSTRRDFMNAVGTGLVANSARTVAAAKERVGFQSVTDERSVGWLSQWQLGYRSRIFATLGARLDRHSAFGGDAPGFFLPRAGLSYVVSEEPFWQGVSPWVPTLRLRAAYGSTGRSPAAGAALQTYAPAAYVLNSGQLAQGVSPSSIGNPDLRPEKGTELEAGFDAAFAGDRAGIELTVFRKTTRDLLLSIPVPPSVGFPGDPLGNVGRVRNEGVELVLRAQLVSTRSLGWDARLAASTLRNRLVSLGDLAVAPVGGNFRFVEGRPLGAVFSQRIRQVDAANNRAIVSDTAEFVGSSFPNFEGNFTTGLSLFRAVRIHSLLDWKAGHTLHNGTHEFRERFAMSSERRVKINELPPEERLRRFGPYVTESGRAAGGVLEPYLEKGDFLRWRELAVTWTLPPSLTTRFAASGLGITVGARNLGLWTGYTGADPEVVSYVSEIGGRGQWLESDVLTMPQPRRWLARVSIDF